MIFILLSFGRGGPERFEDVYYHAGGFGFEGDVVGGGGGGEEEEGVEETLVEGMGSSGEEGVGHCGIVAMSANLTFDICVKSE